MADQAEDQSLASHARVAQELRQINEQWVEALQRRDTATLDRIMADDFMFAYPLEGDDKAQFIADIESGELSVEAMSRERVNVRVHGETAILTGRDRARWHYKGRSIVGQYQAIHVYARREGRWQLVAAQVCPCSQI